MKSLSRNATIALFFAFAIGSIYGCAEKPITFAVPGVQIWKLDIIHEDGAVFKDVTLLLKPSATEKDVFHVTVSFQMEGESENWGKFDVIEEWKGEVRNGMMLCEGTWVKTSIGSADQGDYGTSTVKGTFSKRRASGTIRLRGGWYGTTQAKWTAERIS